MKWNKGSILKATVDYIKNLQSEQSRFRLVEQRNKDMGSDKQEAATASSGTDVYRYAK